KRCGISGFVKATSNGAATGQAQMGATDLAPTVINGQTEKTSVVVGADKFLLYDSVTTQLRCITSDNAMPVGVVVQRVESSIANTPQTGAIIPLDDTIPQISEGVAISGLSLTITPRFATSRIVLRFSSPVSSSLAAGAVIVAIFRDSVVSAVAAGAVSIPSVNHLVTIVIDSSEVPGAGTFVYSTRMGVNTTSTGYLNGNSAGHYFGSVGKAIF